MIFANCNITLNKGKNEIPQKLENKYFKHLIFFRGDSEIDIFAKNIKLRS